MGGDFNVIRSSTEKLNEDRLTSSMKDFDSLIRECSLGNIPLCNASFTWSNRRHYIVASQLDRFLFSSAWEDVFLDLVEESLPHQGSDHFPIVLESSEVMWVLPRLGLKICGATITLLSLLLRIFGVLLLWRGGKDLNL